PVTADAGDESPRLCDPQESRFPVFEGVKPAPTVALDALTTGKRSHLGSPREPLSEEQDEPVDDQEDRRDLRRSRGHARGVLERDSDDAGGDAGADDDPREPLGGRFDAPLAERREERLDDLD